MYTLDTNAIIYYAKGDEGAVSILQEIFREGSTLYISTVSEIELFGFPGLTAEEAEKIEQFLRAVVIMPLDSRLARNAGFLRKNYNVKTIDSAVAATAMLTNTVLVTRNIKDFRRIPSLRFLKI